MPERIASDGGVLLALRPTADDPSGDRNPEPGTVLLYYKQGVGLRLKKYSVAAEDVGGGSGDISGSGTSGKIPVWTASDTLGDSPLTVSGSVVTIPTGKSLRATDAPSNSLDVVNKAYADALVSSGGGWTDDGTVVRLTTATDVVRVGTVDAIPSLEAGYTNKVLISGTQTGVTGGNFALILRNESNGASAMATILACNDQGVGVSLSACGSGWDGVEIPVGLVAGDAGLIVNTCREIDPTGDAGVVIHHGILPLKFISTTISGPTYHENARFLPTGEFIYGDTELDGGEDVLIVGVLRNRGDFQSQSISIIDPGSAGAGFFASVDGESAGLSAANTGRLRYNDATETWQVSMNGSAYADIQTDTASQIRRTKATDQSISSGSIQTITWATSGIDNGTAISYGGGSFTVNESGTYEISARVMMAQGDTDGVRECLLYVDSTIVDADQPPRPMNGDDISFKVSTIYQIAAGHTFEVKMYQNSGESLDIHASSGITHIWARKINSLAA